MLQLLSGVTAVARAAPAGSPVDAQAVASLVALVRLLAQSCSQGVLSGALLEVAAAMELAHLLLIGGGDNRRGSCSCWLHSSGGNSFCASITSPSNSRLGAAFDLGTVLEQLCLVGAIVVETRADRLMLAPKGLQLHLRHLALLVAAVRRAGLRPAGALNASFDPSGASSSGTPSCADPSQVLGGWDAATVMPNPPPAGLLLAVSSMVGNYLFAMLEQPGAEACPRCTPQQMLLVLEGATRCCGQEAGAGADHQVMAFDLLSLHLIKFKADWRPWLPAFMLPAVRTLSAWLLVAAQQLRSGPPMGPADAAAGRAGSSSSSSSAGGGPMAKLAASMQYALAMVLLLPGGVLEAPEQHSEVQLEQLLACCELVQRTGWRPEPDCSVSLGLHVIQVSSAGRLLPIGHWHRAASSQLAGHSRRPPHAAL